jgi:Thioredoxin
MISPVLEDLASRHAERLKVVKVDVDANPGLAARFRAQSIPLLVVIRDGREVDRIVGALPRAALEQQLGPVLAIWAVGNRIPADTRADGPLGRGRGKPAVDFHQPPVVRRTQFGDRRRSRQRGSRERLQAWHCDRPAPTVADRSYLATR